MYRTVFRLFFIDNNNSVRISWTLHKYRWTGCNLRLKEFPIPDWRSENIGFVKWTVSLLCTYMTSVSPPKRPRHKVGLQFTDLSLVRGPRVVRNVTCHSRSSETRPSPLFSDFPKIRKSLSKNLRSPYTLDGQGWTTDEYPRPTLPVPLRPLVFMIFRTRTWGSSGSFVLF